MAGKFWYPSHWSDLAPEAFVQAPADHDSHGFGADFVARQEDRDRALEDYLNTLPAAAGGVQGDMLIVGLSVAQSIPNNANTAVGWNTTVKSVGSSITLVGSQVQINNVGLYEIMMMAEFDDTPSVTGTRGFNVFEGATITYPWLLEVQGAAAPTSSRQTRIMGSRAYLLVAPNPNLPAIFTTQVFQDSGVALNLTSAGTQFEIVRLS